MMLLVSGATATVSRISDQRLGALLRPGNGNRPGALPWAIDNGAYAGFDRRAFELLLDQCAERAPECLWVAAPDVVADAVRTRERFEYWEPRIRERGYRVALVAQDGLPLDTIPWACLDCVFIGGTTDYKLSAESRQLIRSAKLLGKWVHIGRVNTARRIRYAYSVEADSFDGTKFSRFPDTWIEWGLSQMSRAEEHLIMQPRLGFPDGIL